MILSLFEYRNWTSDFAPETQSRIGDLLRYYPKGHSAFRQLLAYFDNQKIVIPSYTTLQDIFTRACHVRIANSIVKSVACRYLIL